MQVSVLLQSKGSEVVSVAPHASIAEVADVLTTNRIGAVVVTDDGTAIDGVLSEREIVSALARLGSEALASTAVSHMNEDLVTCQPDTTVEELMALMTERRIRRVPVVIDGSLAGLVSIGDVVKDHIASLEHQTRAMHDYISHPY